uniref:Ubiquitin-like protease family profile domain-containing protein n=1 Tax=Chenopodium quinoa TaxID=63459 RepID=A0A803MUT0_CHEQI
MRKSVVRAIGWKKGLGPSKCNSAVVKSGARKGGGVKGGGVKAVNKSQVVDRKVKASSGDFMENLMMEYMKLKSRKRKGKLEQSVYRKQKQKVPKLEGHKVLSKGEVLKTHHDNVGKYPNIVCRVESFCDSVKLFDSRRKQLVEQMGFGGLLELDMDNIPRQFCYWLMARVLEDGTMVFGEGEVLSLCASQVRAVLGIPMGSKPVPMDIGEDEDKIMLVKSLYDVYGVGPKQETISLKRVSEVLCPVDRKLLCTTTNSSNLAASLIPSLTVATQASEYDRCTFTMDWLCDSAHRFQAKFLRDGFRSGSGGSFLFVMIKAALMEDKISRDEYGKLLALDIAYGEEHPLDPRDKECMRRPVTAGTATLASHNQEKEREKVDDVVAVVLDKVMEKLTPSHLATGSTGGVIPPNRKPAEKIVPAACTGDNMEVEDEQRTYMKGQRIWMIDSMYDDAYERHENNVNKLIEALGELFQLSDPTWEEGTISTWGRDSFPVTQPDTCSCGAIMLAAIKHCVRSFDVAFHMDKIHTLRQNLFLSDVNNDLNQMKPKLEDVLPKERRGSRRGGSHMTN